MNTNRDKLQIIEVDASDFLTEVLWSEQPVLVAFWTPWSSPCQILDSVLDEAAILCAGKVKVVKINSDENHELSLWYEINSIPTLLYFVEGNVRATIIGNASKEAILAKLRMIFHQRFHTLRSMRK